MATPPPEARLTPPEPARTLPAATLPGPELDFPLKRRLDEGETWTLLPMRKEGERPLAPPVLAPPEPRRRFPQALGIAAGLVALALAGAGLAWRFAPGPATPTPSAAAAPPPAAAPARTSEAPPAIPAVTVDPPPVVTAPAQEPDPPGGLSRRPEPKRERVVLPEEPALTVTTEPMHKGDLIRPGPGVSPPVPLDIPRYAYPAAARGSGRQVSIRVALLVDEEGKVISAILRERDPSNLGFNEAALEAAQKTRFQPATRDDVPGRMWTELILDFAE